MFCPKRKHFARHTQNNNDDNSFECCEPPFVRAIYIFYYLKFFFKRLSTRFYLREKKITEIFISAVFFLRSFALHAHSLISFFSLSNIFCTYYQLDLTSKFIRLIFSYSSSLFLFLLRIRTHFSWYMFEVNFMLPNRLVNIW